LWLNTLKHPSSHIRNQKARSSPSAGGIDPFAESACKFPPAGRANGKDFVNHIDYAVKLIGIDHVGISSDFDGGGGIDGWNSAAEAFNVTLELVRRGYTAERIGKLWSGNLLRVWGEVEKVAPKLQKEKG
jgi:membrane dipeptidase